MRFGAIIVAAGHSVRMGTGKAKILETILGKKVIRWVFERFVESDCVHSITVVCRKEDKKLLEQESAGMEKTFCFVGGGETRQQSVENGIKAMPECDYVLIHDGARPLITSMLIDKVCADVVEYGASAPAIFAKDTYKIVDQDGFVVATPDRSTLMAVQTPQAFSRALYLAALAAAGKQNANLTDDCQLVEHYGHSVHLIQGDYQNIKLTTPEDFKVVEALMKLDEREKIAMRIGQGYDVHRLVEHRKLILCGVEIPHERGLLGHSDADVAAHALSDALLGAAALGDIGGMFPDTDDIYLQADSLKLLEEVCIKVSEEGYDIGNIDITIVAQRPKLFPYIKEMRMRIAKSCGVEIGQVSVKATTEEGLGVSGQGEGISAFAVCTLQPGTPPQWWHTAASPPLLS